MDTIVQADIFFFITSVVVGGIGIVLLIAGIYLITILRNLHYVIKRVRKETDVIMDDVAEARKFVKKEVKRAIDIKEVIGGVVEMVLRRGKKRARSRAKKKEE